MPQIIVYWYDMSIDFGIRGEAPISGTIQTCTSKNGSLALMCAALLNRGTTRLHGIAYIEEVSRMCEVMNAIGVAVKREDDGAVVITPPDSYNLEGFFHPSFSRIRSGLMLIPALANRHGSFTMPSSGGCKIGKRTNVAHMRGLADLGITMSSVNNTLRIEASRERRRGIVLYEMSDTATVNVIMAAAVIPQVTAISFASANYQVQEACFFLETLGVRIEGIGTNMLRIHGVDSISEDISYTNSEDPIESMTLVAIAATTHSLLTVTRVPIDFLTLELFILQSMGLSCSVSEQYLAKNGRTRLADVTVRPSSLTAPEEKIHAMPYPGINTDNLPFFAVIATQAEGQTLIHDWMWENRAAYFTNLNALGARIEILDQHRVVVHGKTPLNAADITCPPALRPATILFVAMLAARGDSVLRDTYTVRRGYEDIIRRLNAIGADISVLGT